jgi:phosphopantetheinyl transferase
VKNFSASEISQGGKIIHPARQQEFYTSRYLVKQLIQRELIKNQTGTGNVSPAEPTNRIAIANDEKGVPYFTDPIINNRWQISITHKDQNALVMISPRISPDRKNGDKQPKKLYPFKPAGIGIDLEVLPLTDPLNQNGSRHNFLKHIGTEKELQSIININNHCSIFQNLTVLFALKEAMFKATGGGTGSLKNINIIHYEAPGQIASNGKYFFCLATGLNIQNTTPVIDPLIHAICFILNKSIVAVAFIDQDNDIK